MSRPKWDQRAPGAIAMEFATIRSSRRAGLALQQRSVDQSGQADILSRHRRRNIRHTGTSQGHHVGIDVSKEDTNTPPVEVGLVALQAMLYRLESGTPYVFVEALTIQPAAAAAGRPPEDPLLRATLSVRAFWRRSGS